MKIFGVLLLILLLLSVSTSAYTTPNSTTGNLSLLGTFGVVGGFSQGITWNNNTELISIFGANGALTNNRNKFYANTTFQTQPTLTILGEYAGWYDPYDNKYYTYAATPNTVRRYASDGFTLEQTFGGIATGFIDGDPLASSISGDDDFIFIPENSASIIDVFRKADLTFFGVINLSKSEFNIGYTKHYNHSIAVIYPATVSNSKWVDVYDQNGNFHATYGLSQDFTGLAVAQVGIVNNESELWVVDFNGNIVYRFEMYAQPPPVDYTIVEGKYFNLTHCGAFTDGSGQEILCNDTKYIIVPGGDVYPYCTAPVDQTLCTDGCQTLTTGTIDGNPVEGGQCLPATCTPIGLEAQCNFEGQKICTTLTTYRTCGFFDIDTCFDLTGVFDCSTNELCVTDPLLGGNCEPVNASQLADTWTQSFVQVSTEYSFINTITEQEGTTQINDLSAIDLIINPFTGLSKIISQWVVSSVDDFFTADIKQINIVEDTTAPYGGVSCDFTDTLLEKDDLSHNNLAANNWDSNYVITNDGMNYWIDMNTSGSATKTLKATSENVKLQYLLKPTQTGETLIVVNDSTNIISRTRITYNETSKNILIRDLNNNKLLFNDTSLQPTDDLDRVAFETTYITDIDSYHHKITIVRRPFGFDIPQTKYTLPLSYQQSSANTPSLISFNKSDDGSTEIYQVLQRNLGEFEAYTEITSGQVVNHQCEIVETGCQTVRVWGNSQAIPTYHFYKDTQICTSELADQVSDGILSGEGERDFLEQIFDKDFSTTTKAMIALFTIGLLFGLFAFTYMETGGQDKVILVFGTIISGLALLFFTFIAYIPIWYIIVLIIASGGVLAFTNKSR